jgi:hypothetical protein
MAKGIGWSVYPLINAVIGYIEIIFSMIFTIGDQEDVNGECEWGQVCC